MNSSNNSNYAPSSESKFGFNSPPLASGKPAAAPAPSSRPRLLKVRKQSASQHPRSTNTFLFGPVAGSGTGTRVGDLGSNPFQSSSYAAAATSAFGNTNTGNVGTSNTFLFGVNSNSNSNSQTGNSSGFADELRKLNIGSENVKNAARFNSSGNPGDGNGTGVRMDARVVAELPNEIRKLNIDGKTENFDSSINDSDVDPRLSASSAGNHFSNPFGSSGIAMELPNEMKKMNIDDARDVSRGTNVQNVDSAKSFVFGGSSNINDSSSGKLETVHPIKMMNLNLKDSLNKIEKSSFDSGSSRSTPVNVGGKAEIMISNELGKLKVGIGIGAGDAQQVPTPTPVPTIPVVPTAVPAHATGASQTSPPVIPPALISSDPSGSSTDIRQILAMLQTIQANQFAAQTQHFQVVTAQTKIQEQLDAQAARLDAQASLLQVIDCAIKGESSTTKATSSDTAPPNFDSLRQDIEHDFGILTSALSKIPSVHGMNEALFSLAKTISDIIQIETAKVINSIDNFAPRDSSSSSSLDAFKNHMTNCLVLFGDSFNRKMNQAMLDMQASQNMVHVELTKSLVDAQKEIQDLISSSQQSLVNQLDVLENEFNRVSEDLQKDSDLMRSGMKTYVNQAVEYNTKFQQLKIELMNKFTSLQNELREALSRINIE